MLIKATRFILGLIFIVFGFNAFFHFIPLPPSPPRAQAFMGALMQSGYFFPMLKITELTCGFFLLLGRWVPLVLIILAPVILNIFLFHLFLAPDGLLIGCILVGLEVFLAWSYRRSYGPLFQSGSR